jgi:hypothetical protein
MASATTIRTGFLEQEDRLLMDFVYPDEIMTFAVSRRIARRMITGLAQILANPNGVMARIPASHQNEMLIWEHLSALNPATGETAGSDGGTQPQRPAAPWPLLHTLNINTLETGFRLSFETADHKAAVLQMNRGELHRLLANLRQLARHAEWDLDAEVGWLVEADSPAAMRPGSLAS